jgi:hypothetical protein
MARKTKRPAKRRASPKRKVSKKKSVARVKRRASTARKVSRKKPVARRKPPAAPAKRSASGADVERQRLLREERALERDVENEEERSELPASAEYIPGALEDPLAKELGEAAVESATSGDQAAENIRDEDLDEEEGGPFVQTSARREFARGSDESNPEDAEPADFPTANAPRK